MRKHSSDISAVGGRSRRGQCRLMLSVNEDPCGKIRDGEDGKEGGEGALPTIRPDTAFPMRGSLLLGGGGAKGARLPFLTKPQAKNSLQSIFLWAMLGMRYIRF